MERNFIERIYLRSSVSDLSALCILATLFAEKMEQEQQCCRVDKLHADLDGLSSQKCYLEGEKCKGGEKTQVWRERMFRDNGRLIWIRTGLKS